MINLTIKDGGNITRTKYKYIEYYELQREHNVLTLEIGTLSGKTIKVQQYFTIITPPMLGNDHYTNKIFKGVSVVLTRDAIGDGVKIDGKYVECSDIYKIVADLDKYFMEDL